MGLFNNFPWTNFHELNLDWLIAKVKEIEAAFPEGLVGIPKGGTGADNAADARTNLDIAGNTIPLQSAIPNQTIADVISIIYGLINDTDDNVTAVDNKVKYKIVKDVSDIPNQSIGTATISSVWANMTPPIILITNPQQFSAGEMPESFGIVVIIKNIPGNGCAFFVGEDKFYTNYFSFDAPTTSWLEYFNEDSTIPISNGGTGATNAADALTNLGIDFSGEVLSVAGVGADPTGNVPLKYNDLENVYLSVTELGLAVGSSINAVFSIMPNQSIAILPYSDISDYPTGKSGIVEIVKREINNNDLGYIIFHGYTASDGDYIMHLYNYAPDGVWMPITTHASEVKEGVTVFRCGNLRTVRLDTPSAWCATLFAGDRPSIGARVLSKVYNGSTYVDCIVQVNTDGTVKVQSIYGGDIAGAQYGYLVNRFITYFV